MSLSAGSSFHTCSGSAEELLAPSPAVKPLSGSCPKLKAWKPLLALANSSPKALKVSPVELATLSAGKVSGTPPRRVITELYVFFYFIPNLKLKQTGDIKTNSCITLVYYV
jgi:hypothetical protein